MAGKQAKILSESQQKKVLAYINNFTRYPLRNRAMFLLSVKAGLRAVEISKLRWSHVTDAEGNLADEITFEDRASKGGNGGRTFFCWLSLKIMAGKQAKILSESQQKKVLAYINNFTRYPLRNRAMFLLSVKAGLRAVEISKLRWSHVTDAEGNLADEITFEDRADPIYPAAISALYELHNPFSSF